MTKRLVALFDKDLDYVNRFMAYVKERRNLPFKMAGFSEFDSLIEFLERNRTDILIVSDDCELPEQSIAKIKTIRSIGEIVFLGDISTKNSNKRIINKYQSADAIISEVLCSMEVEISDNEISDKSDLEIIGVFSPSGGQKKQCFSLCLANAISKNKSVLYINLERFSGINSLMGISKKSSLSDLIYFYQTDTTKIRDGLSSSVQAIGNFHCLTAPLDYEDMDVIGDDNWYGFLSLLATFGGYECIVVDMDEGIKKICSFFEICKDVYVPVVAGPWAEKRLDEFKEYLKLCEKERILDKIVEINMGEVENSNNVLELARENYLQYCFLGRTQIIAENAYYKGAENGT